MVTDQSPLLAAYAKVLRRRRKEAGLSQEELAARAELSMRYVSLLESRKHQPSLAIMKALADVLGVTLTEMIAEAEGGGEPGDHTL
ncbi:helix-turn-helix domain-containing protein [Paenirhodobacter populi]|uniref:helix-turn-helix domain-containing protein n=1 Tax=Paenirhodobacter populi TaxID=2306993 RepID=UPI000FE2B494|nr:helix-turn-helix transcriptional regulator [Sinirhodobacter populi]RWR05090.1 XRE family transcriptional regulator [Sinirhodobacter populi]